MIQDSERGMHDTLKRVIAAILALSATLFATSGAAQTPTERSAMARALFHEGLAEAQHERFDSAADRFRRAHLLRPAPGIAYNLASALVHLGRLVEASEQLAWVVRHDETPEPMRVAALATIAQIEPRLARARIVVEGPLEDVELRLDGEPLALRALLDVAVPMDPGTRVITALRRGELLQEVSLELTDGAHQEVRIAIPPEEPVLPAVELEPPPPVPVIALPTERIDPPSAQDYSWLLWTGVALGAAALAATTTALLIAPPSAPPPIEGTTSPPILEWH
jgi:hypothetical protein